MQEDNKISGDTTVSDPVRVAAAKLLNEHSVQLLHLEDMVDGGELRESVLQRAVNIFAKNIWAALLAIVKGHELFEPFVIKSGLGGKGRVLEGVHPTPMTVLETLVIKNGSDFKILVNEANERSIFRGLMSITSLLNLIKEVPALIEKKYEPLKLTSEAKINADNDIPSCCGFQYIYKKVYSIGLDKNFRTIEQIVKHAGEKENSKIKIILETLGLTYQIKMDLAVLSNYLLPGLIDIIDSYLPKDCIKIYQDDSKREYLVNSEIDSLFPTYLSASKKFLQELLKPFINKKIGVWRYFDKKGGYEIGVNGRSEQPGIASDEMMVLLQKGNQLIVLDKSNSYLPFNATKSAEIIIELAQFIRQNDLEHVIRKMNEGFPENTLKYF